MKHMGIVTAAGAALIWTASFATPALAQSAGTAGAPGSQAGSGQRPGTQGPGETGTHDPGAQGGIGTTTEGADVRADARSDDRAAREKQEFFERAAIASMAEVQLGQLGVERAQDPQVKEFAQTMVREHTAALEQLRSVASVEGVQLPSELDTKHRRIHEKLSETDAEKFDRSFMKAMVDTHKSTEKLLRKRAGESPAPQSARATGSATSDQTRGTSGSETADEPADQQATPGAGSAGEAASSPGVPSDSPSAVGTAGTATPSSAEQWAAMTLPKVQSHLEQARSLEDQVKNAARRGPDASERDEAGSTNRQ